MSDREQIPPATADPAAPAGATAAGAAPSDATGTEHPPAPASERRQDAAASLLLLVSGIAAGLSLLLPWLADDDVTGLTLVRDGFSAFGDGVGEVIGTGYVQPLTIVLGGGVLFVLGLLLLVPARRHRLVGLIALAVAFLVTVAVLVPLAIAGWDLGFFGIGFWFAIAVAVLGLLGALKALVARTKKA
jgi:hypothetical protein